jgi:branched-chain amino acid aminotransferase
MIVFLNGDFVPEEEARISVFDRAFLYGDGLFETLRISNGKPFRWAQHLERLQHGQRFLKLQPPFGVEELETFANELLKLNQMREAVMRLTISRGTGQRGYTTKGTERPTVVMTLHPVTSRGPESSHAGWRLQTSSIRIAATDPLAAFKTCNKLPQILARSEADAAGADEALVSNTDGYVVEGTSSNLFWIEKESVCTPPLSIGVLPGVTRAAVFELCDKMGLPIRETVLTAEQLVRTEGVFLSLSTLGIVPALELNKESLAQSPLIQRIRAEYCGLLRVETQR